MGVLDLYTADFPHGTEDGHRRGCKGAACSNHGTDAPTCATAHRYFLADYRYRRLVEAGDHDAAAALLLEETNLESPAKVRVGRGGLVSTSGPSKAWNSRPVLGARDETPHAREPQRERVDAARPTPTPVFSPAQEAAARPKAPPQVKASQHGTAYGYQLGCRKPENCPADPTCSAAMSSYQQELKVAKKRAAELGISLADLRKLDARAAAEPVAPAADPSPADPEPVDEEAEASRLAAADIEGSLRELGDAVQRVIDAWTRHFGAGAGPDDFTLAR